jgi:hypothetical protein
VITAAKDFETTYPVEAKINRLILADADNEEEFDMAKYFD